MTTAAPSTRVLLVDDDPWTRGGAAAVLSADDRILVEACTLEAALGGAGAELDGPDVLVIDVQRRSHQVDRYRGVCVVDAVRRSDRRTGRRRTVVALTSGPADGLLEVRAAEAGADVLWCWHDVAEAELLQAVCAGVHEQRLDVRALKAAHGLDPTGSVNTFVDQLVDEGLVAAFAPGTTQQGSGLARRRSMALRRRAAEVAGLRTTASVGATSLATPSWREVRRFVQRAVGWVPDRSDEVRLDLAAERR